MPELPDVQVYVERLRERFGGHALRGVRVASPFLLRSVDPPLSSFAGRSLGSVTRMGKRIVFDFADEMFLVVHLMIAGRFKLGVAGANMPGKIGQCAFDFDDGVLFLTEAGTKRRASLTAARGADALRALDPGGLEPLSIDAATFARALRAERHTLKRSLTDPHVFSGIGNAYSDEILHHARISPLKLTTSLTDDEMARLFASTQAVLQLWLDRLREEEGFPTKVTAFREGMAVHGRYGQPCPDCGAPVQRIKYAENEANYCARCQNADRLLADRALSRLMKDDWPRTLDELEGKKRAHRA